MAVHALRESTQLPRAEMPRQHQHAAPFASGAFVVFKAIVADYLRQVIARDPGKLRELAEQAAQTRAQAVEDFAALPFIQFGHRHLEYSFARLPLFLWLLKSRRQL